MKIAVVPASAQTSRAAVEALLEHPSAPAVVGIYRNLDKVPRHFKEHPRFKAVRGDISDRSTLDFAGSHAVITMTPPKYDGSDYILFGKTVMGNIREAIKKSATVERVVYVSSMGAQFSQGVVSKVTFIVRRININPFCRERFELITTVRGY